jgi:hypothetical protein
MFDSTIKIGLPAYPNIVDADLRRELIGVYSAIRNVAEAVDVRAPGVFVTFTDAVTYGQAINLYNVAGVLKGRLSSLATSAKPIRGFYSGTTNQGVGGSGLVILGGVLSGLTGLTPGALYYGSDTPGSYSLTPGTVSQKIGYALSTTTLYVRPDLI